MKKFLASLVLLLLAGGYVYWPYATAHQLEDALRRADRAALEKLVDFPVLRSSMKAQAAAQRVSLAANRGVAEGSFQQKMLADAGLFAGQLMTEHAIDYFVTPERLTELLCLRRSADPQEPSYPLTHLSWKGVTTCTVDGPANTRLTLHFEGLGGWRVTALEGAEKLFPVSPNAP